ncbi:hypothetical protein MFIFM68171_09671 [Madurella fahalii]|uniref:Uncharacterized protein n=1 Tax=Madurella fahalii TaxID=1157608 RepID=A0ABQ0GP00_9PEZI
MQAKALIITLFIALSAAAPSPQKQEDVADVFQGTVKNPDSDSNGDVSILAQKTWQASGGCKTDWDEDRRCVNQCIGEANSKCPGWDSMTGVIQGGCVLSWRTCLCVCEY